MEAKEKKWIFYKNNPFIYRTELQIVLCSWDTLPYADISRTSRWNTRRDRTTVGRMYTGNGTDIFLDIGNFKYLNVFTCIGGAYTAGYVCASDGVYLCKTNCWILKSLKFVEWNLGTPCKRRVMMGCDEDVSWVKKTYSLLLLLFSLWKHSPHICTTT